MSDEPIEPPVEGEEGEEVEPAQVLPLGQTRTDEGLVTADAEGNVIEPPSVEDEEPEEEEVID